MEEAAGQKLKEIRERLKLRYRDVEDASMAIAERHGNDEFVVALSRLADIENKGVVPSIFRMYSLCAIYRLDMLEVLDWYGVSLAELPGDAARVTLQETTLIGFRPHGHGHVQFPLALDPGLDLRRTTYLSRMIQRWGKLPLMLLNGYELENHRYAFIGTDDWVMYPLLQPGSIVLIDETKCEIVTSGWNHEYQRPIYFLEHRRGYACGWCNLSEKHLILQPHPASGCTPQLFNYPGHIEVIGQIVGVAMRLDLGKRRRTRS